MIVLGLDPGLANLGWCVRAENTVVAAGVHRTKSLGPKGRAAAGVTKGADKMRRADELGRFLAETFRTFRPSLVAHEAISLGFHQSLTLLDMGLAFGAIAAACESYGARRVEVAPRDIKGWAEVHLQDDLPVPTGKANKVDVIRAVKAADPSIVWPKATGSWEHLADAYVVAAIARRRVEQ